jgi:hypothetical protein
VQDLQEEGVRQLHFVSGHQIALHDKLLILQGDDRHLEHPAGSVRFLGKHKLDHLPGQFVPPVPDFELLLLV